MMYGPDGGQLAIKIIDGSRCEFEMGDNVYEGSLDGDGNLQWNDGFLWIRTESGQLDMQHEIATNESSDPVQKLSKNQCKKQRLRKMQSGSQQLSSKA